VLSDACTTCSGDVALYRQATFQSVDLDVSLLYGDSRTGTHAFGLMGKDKVGIAGFMLPDQYFAAINNTNTSVEETGSAGIFGLGFPVNRFVFAWYSYLRRDSCFFFLCTSVIWSTIFKNERTSPITTKRETKDNNNNFNRQDFPDISWLDPPSTRHARQISSSIVPAVFHSYATIAPLLARLAVTNALSLPMFTVALQRDTVEIGGNVGLLSIGELPGGIKNESMTWAPVRLYTKAQGGLPPPPDSPNEVRE
jgi:Eukaryotic aspartyl protease